MILDPYDEDIMNILLDAFHFERVGGGNPPIYSQLFLPDNQKLVVLKGPNNKLEVNMHPRITAMEHHIGKELMSSIYFEFGNAYARMTNGVAVQTAVAIGCGGLYEIQMDAHKTDVLVAAYPDMPMRHEMICSGMRMAREGRLIESVVL